MNKKPALLQGEPLFQEVIPLDRPMLPDPQRLLNVLQDVFLLGQITNDKYVKRFEDECSEYLKVKNTIAVSSCTSGLMLMIKALGLEGEVIVPSFTFSATAHALSWNGLKPVFVDCEQDTFNIDPDLIEQKITENTSAILAVYIFGNPPKIDKLGKIAKKHNLKLLFDSAHAFGAKYKEKPAGGFGDAEVFSLSPSKVLTTGEGGLVCTNNAELARKMKIGRNYGNTESYDPEFVGLSSRMPEINAAIGIKNLEGLEGVVEKRNHLASLYIKELGSIDGVSFQRIDESSTSTYKMFAILMDEEEFGLGRDTLAKALEAENIQIKKYFDPPVHLQQIYTGLANGDLPVTESLSQKILCIPLNPNMNESDVERVCFAIKRIQKWCREVMKICQR